MKGEFMVFKHTKSQIATKHNEDHDAVESDKERLAQRHTVVQLHLVSSIKRGLERGSIVTEENIASALESPILGYKRSAAIKTAREIMDAFVEPISSFEFKNLDKTDILVKTALLMREDITPDIADRVLANFDKNLLDALSERFGIEKKRISIVDRIIEESNKIDKKAMSTRYADYKIIFTTTARAQFEEGYKIEGNNIDDYHFMADKLPKIKLNPFGSSNGSPCRGKYGKTITLGTVKYEVYHLGSDRGDLRAFYFVDKAKKEICIYEFYRH